MDETDFIRLKKEIGIWILIIVGAFGAVLIEHVIFLGWSPLWIWFMGISWYATDVLIAFLVWIFFKAKKEDVPVLTKVKSIPENSTKPEQPLIQ